MPIQSISDFAPGDDGPEGDKVDGTKLPPYGPGGIYHEKQIGALCAIHCMNNLMQGPHFDEMQLAEVAQQLDAEERRLLGGSAVDSGGNVRADGFFNVQVIRAALQFRGFSMDLLKGEHAKEATANPAKQRGFICNKKEHWFALRRIGEEWFDLNSCLRTPKHFTDSQLASVVNEALTEGYSVFNVVGKFPPCDLETNSKKLLEAVQGCGHFRQTHVLYAGQGHTLSGGPPSSAAPGGGGGSSTGGASSAIDPELLAAAEADPDLAAAIAASLADAPAAAAAPAAPPAAESMDEIRRKRLARFG